MKSFSEALQSLKGKTGGMEKDGPLYILYFGKDYMQHYHQDSISEVGEDYVIIASGKAQRIIPLSSFVVVNET